MILADSPSGKFGWPEKTDHPTGMEPEVNKTNKDTRRIHQSCSDELSKTDRAGRPQKHTAWCGPSQPHDALSSLEGRTILPSRHQRTAVAASERTDNTTSSSPNRPSAFRKR